MQQAGMRFRRALYPVVGALALGWLALSVQAADFPAPKEGSWVVRDFRFHTGEVLPELRLHYTTVGAPTGEPVLVLHGTTGSGTGMLNPASAASCLAPGSRWTPAGTTSFCRTPSVPANRASRRTGCARASRDTTTTTWWTRSTGWSRSTWA